MKTKKKAMRSEKVLIFMLIMSGLGTFGIIMIGTIFFRNQVDDIPLVNDKKDRVYESYYALIVDDTTDPFWQSVYAEARDAGREKDIYVELLGDDLEEDYSISEKFEIALASNVGGIMIAPEGEDIEEILNEAAQEGVPVVTLLNDSLKGERKSFVGVNSEEIAKLYWKEIERMDSSVDEVLILIDAQQQMSNKNMMYLSIKETLEAQGLSVEVKSIDRDNAFSAEELIRNIILSPRMMPDLLVCLNMNDTLCAYQAVIDYNKVGEVAIMGYYQSDILLEGISKGIIDATLAIDTKQLASQGIEALYRSETNQVVNAYFTVDVDMINEDKLEGTVWRN